MLFVLVVTASLPLWIGNIGRYLGVTKLHDAPAWMPVLAGIVFVFAFFIPEIHVIGDTDTFQQHFVGGGAYAALLYVYCKQTFGWRLTPLASFVLLFAWVSAFGAANELLEIAMNELSMTNIYLGDASWDLLANTVGAFCAYALLCVFRVEKLKR